MAQRETLEETFRAAERIGWQRYGCAPAERRVRLPSGLGLRVLELGDGEPVLFVHGGGGIASAWTPMWTGWRGGRALALDRPGCGLSDGFSYRGVDLRRHAVEVLEGTLDALGVGRAAVVANSMGGLWSFWLALDRPSRVSRMVQLGCPAMFLGTSAPLPMRLLTLRWLGERMLRAEPPSPKNMRKLFARMGHADAPIADELLAAAAAAQALPDWAEGWLSLVRNVLSLGGGRVTLGAEELRRVEQPVHFIWGAADPFGSADVGRRGAAQMPRASFEVVGRGHLPWLDEPEACRRAVEAFLARTAVPEGDRQREAMRAPAAPWK